MHSEAASRTDFSIIRYGQCWEDADVLLEALNIQPGHVCLSIASAGDNTLAMLTRQPERVIALDLSPAQLACLELRVAAYRRLNHMELLELVASRPSMQREILYRRCRSCLSRDARHFWDAHPSEIAQGIGRAGRFERYLEAFRSRVLPLIHSKKRVERLLQASRREQREAFYNEEWDTWRWRWMFRVFFSRWIMARFGRDPGFFHYVEGDVPERIFQRARHALTVLNPSENPYLQWILTGCHTTALPLALRPENFDVIRESLDRLEWYCRSAEEFVDSSGEKGIDCFNLSDIFEYISPENYRDLLEGLVRAGRSGARLAYWNVLVARHRPESLADKLRSLEKLSQQLHSQAKAFFYSAFVIEEIV